MVVGIVWSSDKPILGLPRPRGSTPIWMTLSARLTLRISAGCIYLWYAEILFEQIIPGIFV
jgi:hypothetical protein